MQSTKAVPFSPLTAPQTPVIPLVTTRLAVATLIAAGLGLFFLGTGWDVHWHMAIGRDKVFTAPHLMMLAGIILTGLASLFVVLRDTWSYRQNQGVTSENSVSFLNVFHASTGFIVAGFGALLSAIAFPLDDYWHILYGIDVVIWAPFHVMIVSGMIMAGIGAMYAFAAEANRTSAGKLHLWAQLGLLTSTALTLAVLYILLPDSAWEFGLANIGPYTVGVYPVLVALTLPFFLLAAAHATRLTGAATLIAALFVIGKEIAYVFIPWAVEATRVAEGLAYRPTAPDYIMTPYYLPSSILLVALIVDLGLWLSRQRQLARTATFLLTGIAISAATFLLDRAWLSGISLPTLHPTLDFTPVVLATIPLILLATYGGMLAANALGHDLAVVEK